MQEPQIINLPKFIDARGNLSFIEENNHIPFKIARSYWIYDVPGGETRGGHAYKENQEFIVALSGSFNVILDNGKEERTFSWRKREFSRSAVWSCWVPAVKASSERKTVRCLRNFASRSASRRFPRKLRMIWRKPRTLSDTSPRQM